MNGENELPEGWAWTNLGTVSELVSGAGFPIKYQGFTDLPYPFFKVGNLGQVNSSTFLTKTQDTVNDEIIKILHAKIIPPYSILFAKIGMAIQLNRRRINGVPCCIDNNMMAAIPSEIIDYRFLHRFLETIDFMQYTQATTVPSLRKGDLNNIAIPLPPLAEQRRIVAAVEALLARVNASRERLDRVPGLLKAFRQAVLAAACSGRLTEGWRGENPGVETGNQLFRRLFGEELKDTIPDDDDPPIKLPPIPEKWNWVRCNSLCDIKRDITYGVIKLGHLFPEGVPTLRSSDVRWLKIDSDDVKTIDPKIASQYSRTFLRGGEIVITVRGSLGGVAIVPKEMAGYNISREVAVIPLNSELITEFFCYTIASQWSQDWLSEVTKGVTYTGINIRDLKRLPLPLPSLTEQHEIVRRVKSLFALADHIELRLATGTERADRLTQAILAKAFHGELVPTEAELARREGREYEPAGVLLERIRRERELQGEMKPRKRKIRSEKGGE